MSTETKIYYKVANEDIAEFSYDCIPQEGGPDCLYCNLIYNSVYPTALSVNNTKELAPWLKSKQVSEYKIAGEPIEIIEPGSFPYFGRSKFASFYSTDDSINGNKALNCLAGRFFLDGEEKDLSCTLTRNSDTITITNMFTNIHSGWGSGCQANRKITIYANDSAYKSTGTKITAENYKMSTAGHNSGHIFEDKVLPTRLLILLQAGGGGGGGGDYGFGGQPGYGGGAGAFWLGVVKFEVGDKLEITVGSGGNRGGESGGDGGNGQATILKLNGETLVTVGGGKGGSGGDSDKGGSGGTMGTVTINNYIINGLTSVWTIFSSDTRENNFFNGYYAKDKPNGIGGYLGTSGNDFESTTLCSLPVNIWKLFNPTNSLKATYDNNKLDMIISNHSGGGVAGGNTPAGGGGASLLGNGGKGENTACDGGSGARGSGGGGGGDSTWYGFDSGAGGFGGDGCVFIW